MKRNIRSKKIVTILLIAFLMLTATNVYAANDSFETTISASNSQVKRDATVTITIGLDKINITSGEKGIGGYTGNIKFDSSVLEYVSASGTDKWDKPLYQDGLITSTTSDGEVVKTTQSIATITFKVKKDAKLGDTIIKLENFSGSIGEVKVGEESDIPTGNKSIKLTVIDNSNGNGSGNNGGNGNTGTNKPGNNGSNNDDKLNVIDTSKENIKDGKLPQTGINDAILFVTIAGCIVLSVILYARVRSINGKMKNNK